MQILKRVAITFVFSVYCVLGFSSDSARIHFCLDSLLVGKNISLTINDGISDHVVQPKPVTEWKGLLFSPFGHISILFHPNDTAGCVKNLFFTTGESTITILPSNSTGECITVMIDSSSTLKTYKEFGGALLDSFTMPEYKVMIAFYKNNKDKFINEPALLQRAIQLGDSFGFRKIEFIKQHPNLYISTWVFQNEIVKSNLMSPDSLMRFFNLIISPAYKKSEAGQYLSKIIQNKIAVNSNATFPDFASVDIYKDSINTLMLRGKFVLVQIWASWCVPCLKEIPILKEINQKYRNLDFKLISFSIDTDSIAFQNAVRKYSMNWTQIFGDHQLYNSLATIPIPQVYLIDKNGKTIYNRNENKDFDLVKLRKILADHLN